jgi:hypothetical protein
MTPYHLIPSVNLMSTGDYTLSLPNVPDIDCVHLKSFFKSNQNYNLILNALTLIAHKEPYHFTNIEHLSLNYKNSEIALCANANNAFNSKDISNEVPQATNFKNGLAPA